MPKYLIFDNEEDLYSKLIENRVGKVLVADRWVCLLRTGSKLFAFDENCPHQNYSLAGAFCENGHVICPLHKFRFNLEQMKGHGLSLSSYLIEEQNGKYYIQLP